MPNVSILARLVFTSQNVFNFDADGGITFGGSVNAQFVSRGGAGTWPIPRKLPQAPPLLFSRRRPPVTVAYELSGRLALSSRLRFSRDWAFGLRAIFQMLGQTNETVAHNRRFVAGIAIDGSARYSRTFSVSADRSAVFRRSAMWTVAEQLDAEDEELIMLLMR